MEYDGNADPNCRGKILSDEKGHFLFVCVKPVAYPISNDGPVGELVPAAACTYPLGGSQGRVVGTG